MPRPGSQGLVSLLTDFGSRDTWVGQMKAVMLAVSPSLRLVDLTHHVPPQDVELGALLLAEAVPAFPRGSVHLAVVDPGVGSPRAALVLEAGGHLLVGPDNGLLLPAARALGGPGGCRRLERVPRPTGLPPCETFHGRDLFAPAAALLASGKASPEELGPAAAPRVVPQEPTPPHRVLRVDGFGNLITSLPGEALRGASAVRIAGHLVTTLVRCYADAAPGAVVALAGSSGRVEISAVQGSAAALLRCGRGDPVELLTA